MGAMDVQDAIQTARRHVLHAAPDAHLPAMDVIRPVPDNVPVAEAALHHALQTAHQTAGPHAEASAMVLHQHQ